MKAGVETMRQELKNDATFKEVYHFSFTFGLGENQKSLRKFINPTGRAESPPNVVCVSGFNSEYIHASASISTGCRYSILVPAVAWSFPKTGDVVRFRSEQVRPLHIQRYLVLGKDCQDLQGQLGNTGNGRQDRKI